MHATANSIVLGLLFRCAILHTKPKSCMSMPWANLCFYTSHVSTTPSWCHARCSINIPPIPDTLNCLKQRWSCVTGHWQTGTQGEWLNNNKSLTEWVSAGFWQRLKEAPRKPFRGIVQTKNSKPLELSPARTATVTEQKWDQPAVVEVLFRRSGSESVFSFIAWGTFWVIPTDSSYL